MTENITDMFKDKPTMETESYALIAVPVLSDGNCFAAVYVFMNIKLNPNLKLILKHLVTQKTLLLSILS